MRYNRDNMYVLRLGSSVVLCLIISSIGLVSWVSANTLQVAPTVTLENEGPVPEGSVVVSNEDTDTYQLSTTSVQEHVFGVTAMQPALVFSTGADQIPVVTEGTAFVQVTTSNGPIERGDLLVTSDYQGVAMRAGEFDDAVFAIALQAFTSEEIGMILAEIGVDRAKEMFAASLQAEVLPQVDEDSFSFVRAGIATVLTIGALFFVLYSFRSTIAQGVVSIGRNPRARSSIMTLAFGNIIFALILFGIIVFIAIAVLVLPL